MASQIDPTKPVDGVPASKADLRSNLQSAKDEIEALQSGKTDLGHQHTLADIADAGALADKNTVATLDIDDDAVTTAKIAGAAVIESKIADSAITENKIAGGAISESKIADGAVTTAKIAGAAVIESKIADAAITAGKIASAAVIESKIADAAITQNKIAGAAVTDSKIASGAVTGSKIADDAVTQSKIADAAVSQSKIADGAITQSKIAADAVGATQLQDGIPISMQGALLSGAELIDYAETSPAPAISAGTLTLDLNTGSVFDVVLTTNVTSVLLANPPAAGRAGSATLILKQDATGGRTVTWPASVRWAGGTPPLVTPAANAVDIYAFITRNGGARRTGLQLMLGVLRAAIPGAAFAQTWPNLISRWTFDEVGGPTFGDSGPANVPMNIGGTWADLSTASLIEGVGGTSAYTNGSGYATIPAGDPQHDLAALTISFYYQRHSAAAKHILLAAGDGTQAGDFSIEVLANGRLRGYHLGQDAVLRFFEGGDGITGTNLQVGTAHRIDLTLGSLGARIYLDGVPLTHAFILANTNGWNNSRTKYLGIFTDGVGGPADGVFDGLRLWDQQLNSAQIATLEPAQSITQSASLPLIPEMDFLASDGVLPGSGIVYVYDTALGTGSGNSAANAKEIQAAINAATAGQTLVAIAATPGGTSFYNRPPGLTFGVSGASGNPITLMARPGDTVVIDRGQEFATFRTPSSGLGTKWELFNSTLKIWRSVSTGFGSSVRRLGGHWFEFGWPHYILPCDSLANLQAPLGKNNIWTNYGSVCAMVHTDGRIYIRMQKPDPNKVSFGGKWPKNQVLGDWSGWANASGAINFPVSEDPRDYAIWFSVSPGGSGGGNAYRFNSGVSNWVIGEGINSFGHETTVWLNSSNTNITFKRGTDLATRFWLFAAATGGNVSNGLNIQRRRMGIGSHRHCPLVNWKFGGPLEGSHRGAWCETNWQSGGAVLSNLQATDCTFYGWHDTAVRGGPDWKFQQCTFYRIFDDGFQVDIPVAPRNEFHYCYFLDSAFGGPGGAGTMAGSWKVSHCIFDNRLPKMIDVGSSLNPYSEPYMGAFNLAHPDWSQGVSHPHKVYNCTIITAPDAVARDTSPHFAHIHGSKDNGSSIYHEVWNTICCTVSADRFAGNGGQGWVGPSDYVVSRMITDGGSREAHDYLMIHRDCPFHPSTPSAFSNGIIHSFANNDGSPENFTTLAAWKASSKFNASKSVYSPGFLNSAVVADPQIPSAVRAPSSFDIRRSYRPGNPQAVSAARTTTSTSPAGESTAGWTVAPSPWMGALDPNGTSMPVGVQNP